jgi:PPK2 family polyphosphate:nucleotide phosphotransferase
MGIDTEHYLVSPDSKFRIRSWATSVDPVYKSSKDYHDILEEHVETLGKLQEIHFAADRYALLIIFQAMDAAGKDGAIRHVMSGVNPQGCDVHSFKQPTPEELGHDFLWRTTLKLPERGKIGIFNRSYYEEVLAVRVHPELLQAQGLPQELIHTRSIWKDRFKSIVQAEKHLHRNGTRIVKFYLHLSKDEQRKRLLERIDQAEKNWKFSLNDVKERDYWKQYEDAYQDAIQATSTATCPWYVVPADDKKTARLIVSQVVLDTLQDLHLHYPVTSYSRLTELKSMRAKLEN